ncbi:hypothetical protein C5167_032686 [Papaver somniferum]|uniref:Aminotransferase class I/classII domain-containing protein n=1 Tax=Papaver somniferum TaxID=3469 RepID=A0A4Y7K897_PAPSO|nr:hypothetical protein C5167_032686 [Papaver somniferum]
MKRHNRKVLYTTLDNHEPKGVIPQILEHTKEDFFENTISLLRQALDICAEEMKEIACITLLQKPEGSMFVMVKLDTSLLEDISDDMDFCIKLAREEKVIILPALGICCRNCSGSQKLAQDNLSIDLPSLKDTMERMKSFCQRHAKPQNLKLDRRLTSEGIIFKVWVSDYSLA